MPGSAPTSASPSPWVRSGHQPTVLAQSFIAALKREVLQDATCWADDLCRRQVFKWLTRYNTERRYSRCRYQSPIAYETARTTATLPTAA